MNSTEATYTIHLHEWLATQPELPAPCIHVKAPGWEKGLPYGCWTVCFGCVVEAS